MATIPVNNWGFPTFDPSLAKNTSGNDAYDLAATEGAFRIAIQQAQYWNDRDKFETDNKIATWKLNYNFKFPDPAPKVPLARVVKQDPESGYPLPLDPPAGVPVTTLPTPPLKKVNSPSIIAAPLPPEVKFTQEDRETLSKIWAALAEFLRIDA